MTSIRSSIKTNSTQRGLIFLLLSLGTVALVGIADFLTGREISLQLFYMFAIWLAATRGGRGWALLTAAAATVSFYVSHLAFVGG